MRGVLAVFAILIVLHLASPLTGQALAPELLALSRASTLVRQTTSALANCACLESVTRSRTTRKGKKVRDDRDTLQIQVTTIGVVNGSPGRGGKILL